MGKCLPVNCGHGDFSQFVCSEPCFMVISFFLCNTFGDTSPSQNTFYRLSSKFFSDSLKARKTYHEVYYDRTKSIQVEQSTSKMDQRLLKYDLALVVKLIRCIKNKFWFLGFLAAQSNLGVALHLPLSQWLTIIVH